MTGRDFYAELGVAKDASRDDVARAFRKLAAKYHPDRNPGDKASEDKFKKIAEAYQVLSDPKSREAYDRGGEEQVVHDTGFHGFRSTEDVFSRFGDVFGDLFGERVWGAPRAQRGPDVEVELPLRFEEAAEGGAKSFTIEAPGACEACGGRAEPCPACRGSGHVSRRAREQGGFFSVSSPCSACGGTGRKRPGCRTCGGTGTVTRPRTFEVRIPAAVDDGATLRLRGMGGPGVDGGPPGDLLARLRVAPHPRLERAGLDLRAREEVDLATALLGGKTAVPLLRGEAEMTLPAGTQPGQTFRLAGQGLRDDRGRRGDLLVTVQVELPRELTEEQKRVIRELRRQPSAAQSQ